MVWAKAEDAADKANSAANGNPRETHAMKPFLICSAAKAETRLPLIEPQCQAKIRTAASRLRVAMGILDRMKMQSDHVVLSCVNPVPMGELGCLLRRECGRNRRRCRPTSSGSRASSCHRAFDAIRGLSTLCCNFRSALHLNPLIYLRLRSLLLPQCFLKPVPNISAKMKTPPSH